MKQQQQQQEGELGLFSHDSVGSSSSSSSISTGFPFSSFSSSLSSASSPPSPLPSWVSICVLKPRKSSRHPLLQDELALTLSSIATSFHQSGLVKSAVLKCLTDNNQVAVYSIWQASMPSVGPCSKELKTKKRLLNVTLFKRQKALYPDTLPVAQVDAYEKAISAIAHITGLVWYQMSCWDSLHKEPSPCLSGGDIVHLRSIVGEADNEDVLSYSCLAILKAYFHQTEGLLSHTFYKSLDGLHMAGLGVWKNFESATAYLHAPDGAPEESYWRGLGAKTRLGIYRVVFVTEDRIGITKDVLLCEDFGL